MTPIFPRSSKTVCRAFSRRGFLWSFTAVCVGSAAIGISGCDFGSSEVEQATTEVAPTAASTVPLRITSTATAEFNQRVQMAWSAVSEQPLEITSASDDTLVDEAERTDVVLFRTSEMGDLQAADLLTPLAEKFLESEPVAADSFLAGLVNGSMRWGDETYALPLGTALPAVWGTAETDADESLTWKDFSERVRAVPEGQAAEPLAEGWAAIALLHRASTQTSATWLFERNTLKPVLQSPPYVRALEQLVADRERYPQALLTPEEVWSRLHAGELQIAIGWPTGGELGTAAAVRMLPYPTAEEVFIDQWKPAELAPRPPFVSPRGLLVAVAASCRQTAAARTFMTWLTGREGHAAVRSASSNLAANRTAVLPDEAGGLAVAPEGNLARGSYDKYVIETLGDGQVRPSLRLPGADEYLAALDAQVVRALAGEATPEEALEAASEEWEAITERLGRQKQLRAWMQAQGLRGR